jgi:hypothetical protein
MFPGELTFPDDYVEIMDSGSVDETFMDELAKLTPQSNGNISRTFCQTGGHAAPESS